MAALPGWLEPLPDAAAQRALDQWAIEERGIPGIELMEAAGAGLAAIVHARRPEGRVVVVCGKGNNAGDGLVVARLLRERGHEVDVRLLGDPGELQGDARVNFERLPGIRADRFAPGSLAGAAVIVDAILGTGFSGAPHEPAAGAISAISHAAEHLSVVACDVPSGVDASTGEVHGEAVEARLTATFNAAKPGLWIAPGKRFAGEVHVVDIGIPDGGPLEVHAGLIAGRVTATLPRRGRESTKFAAGSVLVCGGSTGLTGAPCLASEAAMRAGAGYVTALVPASLNPIFEARLLEVMTVPLPDDQGALGGDALEVAMGRLERAGALVLGPGLGRAEDTLELARGLARQAPVPLVLDADGLNAHAERLESLSGRPAPTVLTPHAGELGRLLGRPSSEIEAHRLKSVREAARRAGAIVVLKGDDTIVARPDGVAGVSRGGSAALATAGSGDVLSGVLAAYLAKRVDPFQAACAAVHVHSEAGRLAAERIGVEGVIARDVIEALPRALTAER